MNSLRMVTVDKNGLTHEFAYECHNSDTALAIIKGTLEGCESTGWTLKEMSLA